MSEKTDLVHEVGGILLRRANAEGDEWDYAGWVFEPTDGQSYGGEIFRYYGRERRLISLGTDQRPAARAFLRFRALSTGEDGEPWIKCLLAIRRRDKALKMFFECEDPKRWKLTSANVDQGREILLGEAFPEVKDG